MKFSEFKAEPKVEFEKIKKENLEKVAHQIVLKI